MVKKIAPKIRAALSKIALRQAAKGTTPARVLKEFMSTQAALIAAEQADLNELALNRLAGDVTRPRLGTGQENSIGLFADAAYPRTINLWVRGDVRPAQVVRELRSVSYEELQFHEAYERRTKSAPKANNSQYAALLKQMKEAGALASTVVGSFERKP